MTYRIHLFLGHPAAWTAYSLLQCNQRCLWTSTSVSASYPGTRQNNFDKGQARLVWL